MHVNNAMGQKVHGIQHFLSNSLASLFLAKQPKSDPSKYSNVNL